MNGYVDQLMFAIKYYFQCYNLFLSSHAMNILHFACEINNFCIYILSASVLDTLHAFGVSASCQFSDFTWLRSACTVRAFIMPTCYLY